MYSEYGMKIRTFCNFDYDNISKDQERISKNTEEIVSHYCCTNKMTEEIMYAKNQLDHCFYRLSDYYKDFKEQEKECLGFDKMFTEMPKYKLLKLQHVKDEYDHVYNHLSNLLIRANENIEKIIKALKE